MMNINILVDKLDNLFFEFNTYDYKDSFQDREQGKTCIQDIVESSPETLLEIIKDITESDDNESKKSAFPIISELINFYDGKMLFGVSDLLFELLPESE